MTKKIKHPPKILDDVWNNEFYETLFEKSKLRLSRERAFVIINMLKHALKLEGEVAEMGVYKGSTAFIIASYMKDSPKDFLLFDTFEGTPEHSKEDNVKRHGFYADTSLSEVKAFLSDFNNVHYFPGFIPQVFQNLQKKEYAFVHIHLNLYTSTKNALEYIFDKLTLGGIILIEDYGLSQCLGVKKATDEYVQSQGNTVIHLPTGQAIVIKV